MRYTVAKGDTLRSIADKTLGKESDWNKIYNLNKNTLKSGNPNIIYPGEVLEIPEKEEIPPPAQIVTDENPNKISLYIDGKVYSGWKSLNVTRSMEAICGSFAVAMVNNFVQNGEKFPINAGDKCVLYLGNDAVITGYIDDVDKSHDATSRSFTVSGRDKTMDLVDCTPPEPKQFTNKTLSDIAKSICEAFGISVVTEGDVGGAIPNFRLDPTAQIAGQLEEKARSKNIIINSNTKGELVFAKISTEKIEEKLINGQNILSASFKDSFKDRFSKYTTLGQSIKGSSKGVAKDEKIKRFRPMAFSPETTSDGVTAKKRAQWEAIIRAGRSSELSIKLQGWRRKNGNLWEVNRLVDVEDSWLEIKETFLITQINFTLDDSSGTLTVLTLKRQDAFTTADSIKIENDPSPIVKPIVKKPEGIVQNSFVPSEAQTA